MYHPVTQQSGQDIYIALLILTTTILYHPYNIHIIGVDRIAFVFKLKYHLDLKSKVIVDNNTYLSL